MAFTHRRAVVSKASVRIDATRSAKWQRTTRDRKFLFANAACTRRAPGTAMPVTRRRHVSRRSGELARFSGRSARSPRGAAYAPHPSPPRAPGCQSMLLAPYSECGSGRAVGAAAIAVSDCAKTLHLPHTCVLLAARARTLACLRSMSSGFAALPTGRSARSLRPCVLPALRGSQSRPAPACQALDMATTEKSGATRSACMLEDAPGAIGPAVPCARRSAALYGGHGVTCCPAPSVAVPAAPALECPCRVRRHADALAAPV